MNVSVQFTEEELKLIKKALFFGITHNADNQEATKMNELDAKITLLGVLANER